MLRRIPWPAAVVAVLAIAVVVAELVSGRSTTTTVGRAAPALPTSVLVPPRATLASLRGKPAVVNFWASWCDPCRKEAPQLAKLPAALAGRARLIGVDWNDSAGGARAFIRHYGWRFPNLRDADGIVGNRYGISGLPTTFILSSSGRIIRTLRGPQTVATVLAALRSPRT